MISNDGLENGQGATSAIGDRSKSAAGRSESPEAKRSRERREARKQTGGAVGGRGGSEPSTKGNPIAPGAHAVMGEPLSAAEAKEQLYYAHVGLAKVMRSDIDLSELDEEFTVAGKNYAHVANHMYPPLRVVIRFVAPVVLVAVLLVIWGHMIAATPWVHRIRDWWQHRGDSDASPPPPPARAQASPPAEPQSAAGAVAAASEPLQAPPVPQRPRLTRRMGHRL